MINLRLLGLCFAFTLATVSCGQKAVLIVDPVGIPYLVSVTASQTGATTSELTAAVMYGGFGHSPATVKFYNNADLLATTSEMLPVNGSRTVNYKATFTSASKAAYNIKAVVSWSVNGGGHIESEFINYTTN